MSKPLPTLQLSLQFGAFADADSLRLHRATLPRHFVIKCLRHALQCDGELTVRIVDTVEGRALNQRYRQKKYATNVLTFDYSQSPVVVADLVLCAPVITKEAVEQGKSLAAHYAHLLVHGCLHAQGMDHESSEAEAAEMEAAEIAILEKMGYPNPY